MGAGAAFCLLLLVAYHWLPARWRRGVGAGSRRQPPERLVRSHVSFAQNAPAP